VSTDETRALWDAEAATFDDEPDHGLGDPATRAAWRELLLEHLPPAPARVADLGCGTGTLSVLLAAEGYDVRGIDLSPEMVARAEAKAEAAGVAATFAVGDASDPQLPAGSFDVVLSRHVLWALPDPAAGLARWVALLAPGGRLVLVEGRWFTGGGLTSAETEELVHGTGRSVAVRHLPDPVYWGKEISDERYLAVSVH
jgi:SAM-dependent methyltransferase